MKYGHASQALRSEARTQAYVFAELSRMNPKTRGRIRVPQVHCFFEAEIDGNELGFIVMEYVTGTAVRKIVNEHQSVVDGYHVDNEKTKPFKDWFVDAICLLLTLQPPPGTTPGPVGGGRI